jgi:hypothetical protein
VRPFDDESTGRRYKQFRETGSVEIGHSDGDLKKMWIVLGRLS